MAALEREDITARIKTARKEAGITQTEMAELLDVIPRTYQNYESTRVPWSLIGRISDVTGRSTRWLLHGEDDAPAAPSADLLPVLREVQGRLGRIEAALQELLPSSPAEVLEGEADQLGEQRQRNDAESPGNEETG